MKSYFRPDKLPDEYKPKNNSVVGNKNRVLLAQVILSDPIFFL